MNGVDQTDTGRSPADAGSGSHASHEAADASSPSVSIPNAAAKVKCGDCRYFVRDGRCGFLTSDEGKKPGRPFAHAPFWVWSDCYSDREQVRADVSTCCPTFEVRA